MTDDVKEKAKDLIRGVLRTLHEGRTTQALIDQHAAFERDHPELDWPALFKEVSKEVGVDDERRGDEVSG